MDLFDFLKNFCVESICKTHSVQSFEKYAHICITYICTTTLNIQYIIYIFNQVAKYINRMSVLILILMYISSIYKLVSTICQVIYLRGIYVHSASNNQLTTNEHVRNQVPKIKNNTKWATINKWQVSRDSTKQQQIIDDYKQIVTMSTNINTHLHTLLKMLCGSMINQEKYKKSYKKKAKHLDIY